MMTWTIEYNANKANITSYDIPHTLTFHKGTALSLLNQAVPCETNQEDTLTLQWTSTTHKNGYYLSLVNETERIGSNRWSFYLASHVNNLSTTPIPLLNIQSQINSHIPSEIITQKLRHTPKIELYFILQDIIISQNRTTYKLIQDQAATSFLTSQKLHLYHT